MPSPSHFGLERRSLSSRNVGGDYSDIAYDPSRGKYWIVSDEAQSVSLYDWTLGTQVQGSPWSLGYDGGEGVAYDGIHRKIGLFETTSACFGTMSAYLRRRRFV